MPISPIRGRNHRDGAGCDPVKSVAEGDYMERSFLEKLGITDKAVLDQIMAENGKDITAAKAGLEAVTQERDKLKTENEGLTEQIKTRDNDIKGLKDQLGKDGDLSAKLGELQTKYDADTKALQDKLSAQAYDHAADKYLSGFKFSSTLAREAVLSKFRSKAFKMTDDGKFEGAAEFMEELKKTDPSAFAKEDGEGGDEGNGAGGGNGGGQPPHFSNPNGGSGNGGGQTNPFSFSFSAVRKADNK